MSPYFVETGDCDTPELATLFVMSSLSLGSTAVYGSLCGRFKSFQFYDDFFGEYLNGRVAARVAEALGSEEPDVNALYFVLGQFEGQMRYLDNLLQLYERTLSTDVA